MTIDKELIERLAREAHDAFYRGGRAIPPGWDALDRFDRERWMAMVRAFAPYFAEECAKVAEHTHAPFTAAAIRAKFSAP